MKAKRVYSKNQLSMMLNNRDNVLKCISGLRNVKRKIMDCSKKIKMHKLLKIYEVTAAIVESNIIRDIAEEEARRKYEIKVDRETMMRNYQSMRKLNNLIRTLFGTKNAAKDFYGKGLIKNPVFTVIKVIIDIPLKVFDKSEVAVKMAYDRAGDINKASEEMMKEILKMGRKNTSTGVQSKITEETYNKSKDKSVFQK